MRERVDVDIQDRNCTILGNYEDERDDHGQYATNPGIVVKSQDKLTGKQVLRHLEDV